MIIWRMEGPFGKGPFNLRHRAMKWGACRHIPTPTWESIGDGSKICGTEGKYLNEWFRDDLKKLVEMNFVLIKYSIPQEKIVREPMQVLFLRSDAREIRRYSPKHIKRFTMKYFTPRNEDGSVALTKGAA